MTSSKLFFKFSLPHLFKCSFNPLTCLIISLGSMRFVFAFFVFFLHNSLSSQFTLIDFLRCCSFLTVMLDMDTSYINISQAKYNLRTKKPLWLERKQVSIFFKDSCSKRNNARNPVQIRKRRRQ